MFTHLHVHTEYSLLDGLPRLKPLVAKAADLGMHSLAITDHGVMYGAHKFFEACKYNDIKPIIGCEIYVAPRKYTQKVAKLDEKPHHLVLLAENRTGYQNLIRLVSLAHTDGFYYRPRIDKELLKEYSEGLIGLSACLAGEISRKAASGNEKEAAAIAKTYRDIFGKENFFIEIQRNGITEQEPVNNVLIDIAKSEKLPIVATCDVHYINKEDALAQEVLMCISTGKRLEDTARLTRESDEFYLKSEEEMRKLFNDIPEAVDNTELIAERCNNVDIMNDGWVLPKPPIPKEYREDYDKYLWDVSYSRGKKLRGGTLTKEEKDRLEYEHKIISEKGFSQYMIMVMQFTDWIHENNVPHTTRGSAAGSILSFFVGIVNANPLKFNLPFERFLNPLRPKAPDIDLDVASTRREELIEFTIDKYGAENVAHIATFGRMQARGSIRDAGRVLGLPLGYVDQIAKLIPASGQGLAKVDIDKALKMVPELQQLTEEDPDAGKLIDTAKRIEGVAKSQSIHACGLLVTPGPITDYCPVIWDKTLGKDGRMITQYEMDSLEELKLIKVDFLGLTNLDTIAEAVKIIKRERDIDIDPNSLDLEDEATYKLMRDLDTEGVFQFETDVMKATLKVIQPENIFDVSAALALVRPGPNAYQQEYADRKSGKKPVTFLDPRMKEYLSLTYGVLVYQEDIIRTVINLAGMDWGEADRVRKATGKKKPDVLFEMKDELLERFQKHGLKKEQAELLFELFIPFTNYAFNQAHAAAYALVVYQTAYLKTHYPVEFMAALLKSEMDDFDKIGSIISECGKRGIKILPPNINKSKYDFSIEEKHNIRFGLGGIKNLGKSAIEHIIAAREDGGREFSNFDDFLYRIPLDKINQKSIAYLVKVGAFDEFGERNALLSALPMLHEKYKNSQTAEAEGQMDIFGMGEASDDGHKITEKTPLPKTAPATDAEKIEWEKELLGMYITSHPLSTISKYINAIGARKISEIKEMKDRTRVQVGAIISNIKRISTKKDNKSMAFVSIEDQSGSIEVVLFPTTFAEYGEKLVENTPLLFVGKVNVRDGERSIIADSLRVIDMERAADVDQNVILRIPADADKKELAKLKTALKENPGPTAVTIQIPEDGEFRFMKMKRGITLTEQVKDVIAPFEIT